MDRGRLEEPGNSTREKRALSDTSTELPWKFYGLMKEGREFLEDHNLLAAEETLQQIYETIFDKSEKMIKYENAPRLDDR